MLKFLAAVLMSTVLGACAPAAIESTSSTSPVPLTSGSVPSAVASSSPAASMPTMSAPPSAAPVPLLGPLPAATIDGPTATRLQQVVDGLVKDGNPDAIAAVITAQGTWSGAAGTDGPKNRAAKPTDEFGIASVSKTILAALVLRLVEQGKIDLDEPLATYLDGVHVNANGATVREALAMRSGLGDTTEGAIASALAQCEHVWTRDEVLATIPAPFADPGTTFHYSNPTYKLLGYAAEGAVDTPLWKALRTSVLDPAHADRLLLQGPDRPTPKPWALPLEGSNGSLATGRYGIGGTLPCVGFSTLSLGASAMASDAPTLARWGWELFSGRIIGPESLAKMTTSTDSEGHGLGIDRMFDFGSVLAYGHTGSEEGYAALLAILPERQAVVVLFINDARADVARSALGLVQAIGG
jgi:D-alanyl-D-alanine carboxypeptidase